MRNVLLTTLSILYSRSVNFYCMNDKFVSGISQQEPGTKYFLSTQKIDEIIVTGTDKTIDEKDDGHLVTEDILAEMEREAVEEERNPSTYRYYKYRIAQFLSGNDRELQRMSVPIPDERKLQLEKMTRAYFENDGHSFEDKVWLKKRLADNDLQTGELRSILSADIKENFVDEKDYEKYERPLESFAELKETVSLEKEIEIRQDELEKVKRDKSITILGKEWFYQRGSKRIEQKIADLEEFKAQQKLDYYERLFEKLHDLNVRFIQELRALKDRRVDTELAYMKAYLYRNLGEDSYMSALPDNRNMKVRFITNLKDQGEELRQIEEAIIGNGEEEINLYIDMQGGDRTEGFVRSAVLAILNNDQKYRFNIKSIVTVDFYSGYYASQIVDNTKQYQITDLVAGMNAFLRYGKADQIEDYCENVLEDTDSVRNLIAAMRSVDDALSLCNVGKLDEALQTIRAYYREVNLDEIDGVFSVLVHGIKEEYLPILQSEDLDYVDVVDWALKKGFLQQCLAIIEAKMPTEFVKRGIFYYCDDENNKKSVINTFIEGNKKPFPDREVEAIDSYYISKCCFVSKGYNNKSFNDSVWEPLTDDPDSYEQDKTRANFFAECAKGIVINKVPIFTSYSGDRFALSELHQRYTVLKKIRNSLFHVDESFSIDNDDLTEIISDFVVQMRRITQNCQKVKVVMLDEDEIREIVSNHGKSRNGNLTKTKKARNKNGNQKKVDDRERGVLICAEVSPRVVRALLKPEGKCDDRTIVKKSSVALEVLNGPLDEWNRLDKVILESIERLIGPNCRPYIVVDKKNKKYFPTDVGEIIWIQKNNMNQWQVD